MLLFLQNVLYCLLYALLIKCAVKNDGRNCLYFYPKEFLEEAQKRGIADKKTVMKRSNWFDGIVIDRLWVGHSKIWQIDGMERIPYVKSWKTVLIKRGVATVLYLVVALVVAEIVVLLGKI